MPQCGQLAAVEGSALLMRPQVREEASVEHWQQANRSLRIHE